MASEAYAAACCNNKVFLSVVVSLLLPGSNPPRSLLPLLPWSSGWYARLASGRIGITLLPDGGNRGNRVGPLGAGPSAIELLLSSILEGRAEDSSVDAETCQGSNEATKGQLVFPILMTRARPDFARPEFV
jgi:hypothetical protein